MHPILNKFISSNCRFHKPWQLQCAAFTLKNIKVEAFIAKRIREEDVIAFIEASTTPAAWSVDDVRLGRAIRDASNETHYICIKLTASSTFLISTAYAIILFWWVDDDLDEKSNSQAVQEAEKMSSGPI